MWALIISIFHFFQCYLFLNNISETFRERKTVFTRYQSSAKFCIFFARWRACYLLRTFFTSKLCCSSLRLLLRLKLELACNLWSIAVNRWAKLKDPDFLNWDLNCLLFSSRVNTSAEFAIFKTAMYSIFSVSFRAVPCTRVCLEFWCDL